MTEKQPRVKIKKILKICKILFILWIIYLIGIPLYYTPYELQPSYWEFKKMCELNELPNNEEKYNKILSYFDKKLGDRDDFPHTKQYSRRIRLSLDIYPNGRKTWASTFRKTRRFYRSIRSRFARSAIKT